MLSQKTIPHLKNGKNPHILTLSPPLNFDRKWFGMTLAYTTAKYGMTLIAHGLAEELGKFGIASNCLWPRTSLDTAAVRNVIGAELVKGSRKPSIYADAAYAVLKRDSSSCTGNFFLDQDVLEEEGIHTNLTLVFGLHQAIACAENGIQLISPFVGRILDWYKKDTGTDSYPAAEDPGVVSVTAIYNYFKKFGYNTEVMGASFRNLGEITELAGVDLLTISPGLLDQLQSTEGELPRKLSADNAATSDIEKINMDKATFEAMHAEDRMATEKLAEGIEGFAKALETLEELLASRLAELEA